MEKARVYWFVSQLRNDQIVSTRFQDLAAAEKYAAAVKGEVRPPREVRKSDLAKKLFEALR